MHNYIQKGLRNIKIGRNICILKTIKEGILNLKKGKVQIHDYT